MRPGLPFHYPPDDQPFLDYWKGHFESVFILFHPFLRIEGVHPTADGYLVSRYLDEPKEQARYLIESVKGQSQTSDEVVRILTRGAELIQTLRVPEGAAETLSVETISWAFVADHPGIGSIEAVNRALRTSIGGLRAPFADEGLARRLLQFCASAGVFPPGEGTWPDVFLPHLRRLFESNGYAIVYQGDEFDDRWTAHDVATLTRAGPCGRFAPDFKLLAVTHWDSFFSLICGPRGIIDKFVVLENLDGFWADPTTDYTWFLTDSERASLSRKS